MTSTKYKSDIVKKRQPRFAFNMEKDIILLRTVVKRNPWQSGEDSWLEIVKEIRIEFPLHMTRRTLEGRVNLLLKKLKEQQLSTSSGTAEEIAEREKLLKCIEVEKQKAAINSDTVNDDGEVDQDHSPSKLTNNNKKHCERAQYVDVDESIGQAGTKRCRLSFEDEVIKQRPEHDLEMEKAKLEMEREKLQKQQQHDMEMDRKKNELAAVQLELEKERLDIERQRDIRLHEEAKRRDELAVSQLIMHTALIQMLQKLIDK